jgi:hypothetical protein
MAPGGFEQDGFMLKLLISAGLYRYNAAMLGGDQVIGLETANLAGLSDQAGRSRNKVVLRSRRRGASSLA